MIAVLAILVAGRLDQRAYSHHGYAGYDPVFARIDAHAPRGHRIGLTGAAAGIGPVLPAFGPRLQNTVGYVGDVVRHSVHVPSSESSFRSELGRGCYDLLLIGLQQAGTTPLWASAFGYRLVAHSANLALYAAPGARAA